MKGMKVAAVMAVMVMCLTAFAFSCTGDSDATASSSTVDAMKVTSFETVSKTFVNSSGVTHGTVTLNPNFSKGGTYETVSTNPTVKFTEKVWKRTSDGLLVTIERYAGSTLVEDWSGSMFYGLSTYSVGSTKYLNEMPNEASVMKRLGVTKIIMKFEIADTDWNPYTDYGKAEFSITINHTSLYKYTTEVAYDLNGGTGGPTSVTSVTDTYASTQTNVSVRISTASDMAKSGYVFAGWATSTSSTTLYKAGAYISVPAGQTTTLHAIWEYESVVVTFMSDGSEYTKVSVKKGETVPMPADPVKSEHIFVGWFEDSGFTIPWDVSTQVTKATTLYAGWKPDLQFITDPVANCEISSLGQGMYMFSAAKSVGYTSSADSITWKVYKDGEVVREVVGGLYFTHQFMEYGSYQVELTITNGEKTDVFSEDMDIRAPSGEGTDLSGIIALVVLSVLVILIVSRLFL